MKDQVETFSEAPKQDSPIPLLSIKRGRDRSGLSVCPGTYWITATTLITGAAVGTSTASLTIPGHQYRKGRQLPFRLAIQKSSKIVSQGAPLSFPFAFWR